MDYSEDMATSIQDLKNRQVAQPDNLGKKIEYQFDNFDYNPEVIPQATLQRAPPMRQGRIENYPTHQTVKHNNYYPTMDRGFIPPNPPMPVKQNVKNKSFFDGIVNGIYQRIIDPIILTILFIIFAHRMVAKGSNAYLPFVGESPSTDFVSLGLRGFILAIIYLIIRNTI